MSRGSCSLLRCPRRTTALELASEPPGSSVVIGSAAVVVDNDEPPLLGPRTSVIVVAPSAKDSVISTATGVVIPTGGPTGVGAGAAPLRLEELSVV